MLNLRQVKHLVRILDISVNSLRETLKSSDTYYETLILHDPAKPNRQREVVNVTGAMRRLQSKFYKQFLLRKLAPTAFSHGGVHGRSIRTNTEAHSKSKFVFKTDISNFYPTIHNERIYRLFTKTFNCSPDVAHLCTRLCTYRHHLALGLITSPILADQVLSSVDTRIGGLCRKAGLVYTRFVDDITISGPYNLEHSGFEKTITQILTDNGFSINAEKNMFSPIDKQASITGIRILPGERFDVRKEYINELERQLDDASCLANEKHFNGPYYTQAQILGRIHFVCWINPRRRPYLMKKFKAISWLRVSENARKLKLIATKKTLLNPEKSAIPATY